ncbi:MAG: hypothetical protein KTR25_11275 [Myxococcales bacterium]|nr:hypothetical protein [Myxococcales bacterium]
MLDLAQNKDIMSKTANIRNQLGGVSDYLFGRNATIGIASLMLLSISGYATWSGMNDFIVGVSSTNAGADREIPGGLSVPNELLVIGIVIALTFLMWLALRESFRARQRLSTRAITFPLYVFLALWSVGFGYGFWWSLIAGEEATRTSMANLQEDARDAGNVIGSRLEAAKAQLNSVVTWSQGQMAREETSGGSCGIASRAGRGPLYQARVGVRDSISSLRDGIVQDWIAPVQEELVTLKIEAIEGSSFAERQHNFESRAREIRTSARNIAARSNAFGRSSAAELRALADAVSIPPRKQGFSCYDPTLAQRLNEAAKQAEMPAELNLRNAQFHEGPAGVAHAVKTLWSNIGAYAIGTLRYIFSGGQDPDISVDDGSPVTGRDLIALLVTLGIDLGILVLMALNPPLVPANRASGLATPVSKLKPPSGAVVRQLASAISTAVARAPGVDLEWVRRHFIHHRGTSYFVIPNLYSCSDDNQEELKALAMNQLAGVFENVALVRALTEQEALILGKEEGRVSSTDLKRYQDEYLTGPSEDTSSPIEATSPPRENTNAIRNHGLLSKAQRTLDIAGWSDEAKRDVEVYRLIDVEGLTPLLTLLSEASLNSPRSRSPSQTATIGTAPSDANPTTDEILADPGPKTDETAPISFTATTSSSPSYLPSSASATRDKRSLVSTRPQNEGSSDDS